MLMLLLFSELDFASLYEDCRTFFADETYKHIISFMHLRGV